MTSLNIGSGNTIREEVGRLMEEIGGMWILGDLARHDGVVVRRMDARNIPFEDGVLDNILASHLLEHFSRMETHDVLTSWFRKLKKYGVLIIVVPDMLAMAKKLVAFEEGGTLEEYDHLCNRIYGGEELENHHKFGFTKKTLELQLRGAGFSTIRVEEKEDDTLLARAVK